MTTDIDLYKRCRRLAVMGGTFDPIHYGHLAAAEAVRHMYQPQKVLFIPSARPPHKNAAQVAPARHRYRMAALATAEHPFFDVSRLELDRPGPSYTVDTIRSLHALCPAGAEIFFITGLDAAEEIAGWKDPGTILELCRLVVVTRPDSGGRVHTPPMPDIGRQFPGRLEFLDVPALSISGTDIRRRLAEGEPVRYLLPPPVEHYIRRHGLYMPGGGAAPVFDYESARRELAVRLSPKRYQHTLGVIEAAEQLAEKYGADREKARTAALLHDCAKEYSAEKKRTLCRMWDIKLDEILEAQIDLAHSLLSAESARRDFYVEDEEILHAIRYHTTGINNMNMLDKVILLADFIDPYREDYPGLAEIRALARQDIHKALHYGIKEVIRYNEGAGRKIHPWSYLALPELETEVI